MAMQFEYPVKLAPDKHDGGFVVTCRDLPEAITQGNDKAEALDQAEGAVQAALEGRIADRLDIPKPSELKRGEVLATVPVSTAMKAALYSTMKAQGVNNSQLAVMLGMDEKVARRLLDPSHQSKVTALEKALQVLGRRTTVTIA
jgi:antitoxin HicB